MWMTAPTSVFSPDAGHRLRRSTPAFCRKRTFNAIPPTLAGVTRLTNDEAICTSTADPSGTVSGTPPTSPTADVT